jgi:intein-encoded DNA endonuclease-like protein
LVGVVAGDGYATQKSKGYNEVIIGVKVRDWELAEEFARCIGKVLGRDVPKIGLTKDGRFVVEVKSKTLYELLKKPIDIGRIRQYIDHCIRCICVFLRGFFDSEGGVYGNGDILVSNSDKSLLEYIKELLHRLGIILTGPKLYSKAGTPIKDPKTGNTYFTIKHCYYLYIHAESRLRFYQLIGFTIKRKKQRLEEYLIRLLKKEEVLMYQT